MHQFLLCKMCFKDRYKIFISLPDNKSSMLLALILCWYINCLTDTASIEGDNVTGEYSGTWLLPLSSGPRSLGVNLNSRLTRPLTGGWSCSSHSLIEPALTSARRITMIFT